MRKDAQKFYLLLVLIGFSSTFKPTLQARAGDALAGLRATRWHIEADGRIFKKAVLLSMAAGPGRYDARLKQQGLADAPVLATIRGLTERGREYLYGKLEFGPTGRQYRCKLWQRDHLLFLRVYDPYTYHTYRLVPANPGSQ